MSRAIASTVTARLAARSGAQRGLPHCPGVAGTDREEA